MKATPKTPICQRCKTRHANLAIKHPFDDEAKICQKCQKDIIHEAMFNPIKKGETLITPKTKLTKIEKISLADEPFSHRLEKVMDYVHDELKNTYCKCTAPIVRAGVNVDEYCGSCGRDIE